MTDPHVGEGLQVRSELTGGELFLRRVNWEEAQVRRVVFGWDMGTWLGPVADLEAAGRSAEAAVVARACADAAVACIQFDSREPWLYWFAVLARVTGSRAPYVEWLTHWPDGRFTTRPAERARVLEMVSRP